MEIDTDKLKGVLSECRSQGMGLIQVLQRVQKEFGYISKDMMEVIAKRMHLPRSRVFGVATFYSQFRLKVRGRHLVQVCDGTACHIKGSEELMRMVEEEYSMEPGSASEDLSFTYEIVHCLGSCSLAPAIMVDGKVVGRVSKEKIKEIVEALRRE